MANGLKINALMNAEETGIRTPINTENLSFENVVYLNNIFKNLKHIQKIYVDVEGRHYFNSFVYSGKIPKFKEFEGKQFARMEKVYTERYFDAEKDRRDKVRKIATPILEYQIVTEYDRETISDKFKEQSKK